jgi:hypothetical protein
MVTEGTARTCKRPAELILSLNARVQCQERNVRHVSLETVILGMVTFDNFLTKAKGLNKKTS